MSDERVLTTDDVCNHFAYGCGPKHTWDESRADFRAWLAAHDAAVKADAWDEALTAVSARGDDRTIRIVNPYRTPSATHGEGEE